MKKAYNQQNSHWNGLTTIMLDSLAEAHALIRNSRFYTGNLTGDEKKDLGELHQIRRANPWLSSWHNSSAQVLDLKQQLDMCFHQIEHGDPEMNQKIVALTNELKELAIDIEPTFRLENKWTASEEGAIWDAGAIAAGEEKPMFRKNHEVPEIKDGAGDGAYRVIINTDCAWWQDPTVQCAAVAAMAMIVQQRAPLEIWIQQGWLGGSDADGVTVFPLHRGGTLTPQQLFFWIGSDLKDSPYSWTINRMLGRTSHAVSIEAELPCDLYLYNVWMPGVNLKNKESVAGWIAGTARKMLFAEEDWQQKFGV